MPQALLTPDDFDHEVRYWREVGLEAGTDRYALYLDTFGVTSDAMRGRWVCDFGCGPLGGVLSVLEGVRLALPVDPRARIYNAWGLSPVPILALDAHGRAAIPPGACDAVFCTNVLDHTEGPLGIVRELTRITRIGGYLFLFVHLRHEYSKGHVRVRERDIAHHFGKPPEVGARTPLVPGPCAQSWAWEWAKRGQDWPNMEPYITALWGVLRRVCG